jgi:hypothetical protein
MTHCIDFWQKWKREPNFCGLGSSTAKSFDRYIDFVEDFSKEFGISHDVVYRNVPQSAVKPILHFKKDSDVRVKATQKIAETLNGKHAVTVKFVNSVIGVPTVPSKMIEEPKVIIAPMSEQHREAIVSNNVKDKIRLLTSALSTGQIAVLSKVMEQNELNNEYEAISLVIKWAGDRLL